MVHSLFQVLWLAVAIVIIDHEITNEGNREKKKDNSEEKEKREKASEEWLQSIQRVVLQRR